MTQGGSKHIIIILWYFRKYILKFFLELVSIILLYSILLRKSHFNKYIEVFYNVLQKTVFQALFAIGFSNEHFRESFEFRVLFSQKTKHKFSRKPYVEQGLGVTQVVLLMTSRGIRCVWWTTTSTSWTTPSSSIDPESR